jgi:hypothetical protein
MVPMPLILFGKNAPWTVYRYSTCTCSKKWFVKCEAPASVARDLEDSSAVAMAPTDPFYHTHVPASHDPHVATPYWGAFGTSSVDWCEANYLHSQYVAEFWNTLSSLPLVGVMVYGLVKCHQHGIEWRFRLCYLALGLVGCGSVGFHATMTHAGQVRERLQISPGSLEPSSPLVVFYHRLLCVFSFLHVRRPPTNWQ